jgi:hypothetical protein
MWCNMMGRWTMLMLQEMLHESGTADACALPAGAAPCINAGPRGVSDQHSRYCVKDLDHNLIRLVLSVNVFHFLQKLASHPPAAARQSARSLHLMTVTQVNDQLLCLPDCTTWQ